MSWTIIFFSLYPPLSLPPLVLWLPSLASCNSLELDYLPIPRLGQDALQIVPLLLPLSMTCLTLTFTVPSAHASVPVDVHPLCPLHVHISSLLPYCYDLWSSLRKRNDLQGKDGSTSSLRNLTKGLAQADAEDNVGRTGASGSKGESMTTMVEAGAEDTSSDGYQ